MNNTFKFIICILIPEIVGGISGFLTFNGIKSWYSTLHKPVFNPPNFLFGPVWTLLYLLMGVSLYMIWNQPAGQKRTRALLIFGVQLFLNFWWSIIFFNLKSPGIAMFEIVFLLISIIWMILAMKQVKPAAAWLQVPYLLWVAFASTLNAAIWILN